MLVCHLNFLNVIHVFLDVLCLYLQTSIAKCLCVKWSSSISKIFNIAAEVRQSGVLSPVLFAVYVDDIIANCKTSGF